MPTRGKRPQKQNPKYKDSDESEDDGDFSDSGSEASIPEDDPQDEESIDSSGDNFENEPVKKLKTKKLKHLSRPSTSSSIITKKPVQINFQSLKARMDTAQEGNTESQIPFNVKDLTDQEKMLPSFLNLSESDSSDNDDDPKNQRQSTLSDEPMDFNSFVQKETDSRSGEMAKKDKTSSSHHGRLSDSDSEMEDVLDQMENISKNETEELYKKKVNFDDLHDHTKKLEEAKKSLEMYNKKYLAEKKETVDVSSLLAMGETKEEPKKEKASLKKKISSRKRGNQSDSDVEDFEEVKGEAKSQVNVPKGGLQLVLDFPTDGPKPKKPLDLEMMMKRRLNRVKKEYQVYIHKVHVLCWLGHGNFVNKILNNESVMAAALSLIPSEHCYPSNRIDIKYMEQITRWYSEEMTVKEDKSEMKYKPNRQQLEVALMQQINKKTVPSKKNKVLIFISMLRALGVKTRLVFSFKLLPLRPTELCSLSVKKAEAPKTAAKVETSKHFKASTSNESDKKSSSKSKSGSIETKKRASKNKKPEPDDKISQLDGADDRNIPNGKRKPATKKQPAKKSLTLSKSNSSVQSPKCSSSTTTIAGSSTVTLSYWDQITKDLLKEEPDTNKRTSHRDINLGNSPIVKKELKTPDSARSSRFFNESTVSSKANPRPRLSFKSSPKNLHTDSTVILNHSSIKEETLSPQRYLMNSSGASISKNRVKGKSQPSSAKESNTRKSKSTEKNNIDVPLKKTRDNKNTGKGTETVYSVTPAKKMTTLSSDASKKDEHHYSSRDKASTGSTKVANRKSTVSKMQSKDDKNIPKRLTRSCSVSSASTVASLGNVRSCLTPDINEKEPTSKSAAKKPVKNLPTSKNKPDDSGKPKVVNTKIKQAEVVTINKPVAKKTIVRKAKSLAPSETSEYFNSGGSPKISDRRPVRNGRVSHKELANKSLQEERKISAGPTRNLVREIVALTKSKSIIDKKKNLQAKRPTTNCDSDNEQVEEVENTRTRKDSDASDADFKPSKKRGSSKKTAKKDRRVLSTDDEHSIDETKKRGMDVWCEVYVEEEEQWISVDVIKSQVHCAREIYSRASHPVTYIVSWDAASHVKDVTRRYVPHWNTATRRLRTDPTWYDVALSPYLAPSNMRDFREDKQLDQMLMDAPLPSTVGEYKNHPLYALKRHLLKFEVIYPPDAMTLGFVRNEPVYPRECVHTCRSRETWVKEAKVVKLGEEPYKIVKARPKYDRSSGKMITDIPLQIFGPWQCDEYVPPQAENGIVPRNPYGNVELFKACMLPKGTVHLQLPGLNKVARKLGIDCASAMTGFDYHSGWSHPVYDGFVVCEEFKEQIIKAWEEEQEDAEKRAIEKVEKRVYGNWKRLIRGLFIKRRLQAKYDFQTEIEEPEVNEQKSKKRSMAPTKTATKKHKSHKKNSDSDSD